MRKSLILLLVLGFTLSARASEAAALDFTGVGKAQVVTIAGLENVTAWAGELNWQWIGGTPDGMQNPLYTYCIDLLNDVTDPQSVTVRSTDEFTTVTTNGAQKAAWLFDTYAPMIHATGTDYMGAALQLAIWEVIYDNPTASGYSLSSGSFRVASASSQALSTAALYLKALSDIGTGYLGASAAWIDSTGTRAGAGQDQIALAPVPEPGTLMLLGTGVAALAARRRRKATA